MPSSATARCMELGWKRRASRTRFRPRSADDRGSKKPSWPSSATARCMTEVVGGGVFHGAIEVCGAEFSFGGCRAQRSGVFKCEPTKCPMHGYRESAYLGDCGLKPPQVQAILAALSPNWYGPTYDLIRKNCCSFSKAFAVELGVGPVPAWSHRLADAGAALGVMKKTVEDDDIDDVLFEHVMAVRLQRGFRARKEAREKAQLEAKRHREAARAAI